MSAASPWFIQACGISGIKRGLNLLKSFVTIPAPRAKARLNADIQFKGRSVLARLRQTKNSNKTNLIPASR